MQTEWVPHNEPRKWRKMKKMADIYIHHTQLLECVLCATILVVVCDTIALSLHHHHQHERHHGGGGGGGPHAPARLLKQLEKPPQAPMYVCALAGTSTIVLLPGGGESFRWRDGS